MPARADSVPAVINYQGKLTDSAGNPITGTRDILVKIYDSGPGTGGTQNYGETQSNVAITNGVFSIRIGTDPLRRVPMMDPLKGTAEHTAALLAESTGPADLLNRLES